MMLLALRNYAARLLCWHRGHLRGKLKSYDAKRKVFECPRCRRTTSYKVKA
jgi:hypothetical protein